MGVLGAFLFYTIPFQFSFTIYVLTVTINYRMSLVDKVVDFITTELKIDIKIKFIGLVKLKKVFMRVLLVKKIMKK